MITVYNDINGSIANFFWPKKELGAGQCWDEAYNV